MGKIILPGAAGFNRPSGHRPVRVTTYSCGWCGAPVDPAHPERHLEVCPENPMERLKRALAYATHAMEIIATESQEPAVSVALRLAKDTALEMLKAPVPTLGQPRPASVSDGQRRPENG